MKMTVRLATIAALTALATTSACMTSSHTGRPLADTAVDGSAGGIGSYALGDLIGGRRARTARILGAGIGGIAATGIGGYMDQQERAMRARTAGTDVRVTRQGDDLILTIPSGLSFAYKSDGVAPGFQRTLDQIASVLHDHERAFVDVYAHTDATGSDAYNQGLSERRAGSVAAYLAAHGVDRARIGTRGFGKSQPIASNDTPEGQAANRRVEIKVVPISESDLR